MNKETDGKPAGKTAHLEDSELMNYLLGRFEDRESLVHLAKCKRCSKRMSQIEGELEEDSFKIQGQSAGFGLQGPASGKPALSDERKTSGSRKNQKAG